MGKCMVQTDTKELFPIAHNRTFQFDRDWTWYQHARSLGSVYKRYRSLASDNFRCALSPHLPEDRIDRFLEYRRIILRYL